MLFVFCFVLVFGFGGVGGCCCIVFLWWVMRFDLRLCDLFGMMFVWLLWFGCCFGCVVVVYYS